MITLTPVRSHRFTKGVARTTIRRATKRRSYRRKVDQIEDGLHVANAATRTVAKAVAAFIEDNEEQLRDGRIGRRHVLRNDMVCRSRIVPNLGGIKTKDLSIDGVARLYRDMARGGLAPLTARGYFHVFRMVEQFGRKRGWMKTQPVTDALSDLRGIPPARIETLTPDEVVHLLIAAGRRDGWNRFEGTATREYIVALGALCGMRLPESRPRQRCIEEA